MPRIPLDELDNAVWLDLADVPEGGLDRWPAVNGGGRPTAEIMGWGCDWPLHSIIHVEQLYQTQGVIACYAGEGPIPEGELEGDLWSEQTTVKTQQWWTPAIAPATEDTMISEVEWTNVHAVVDNHHLLRNGDGTEISPAPVCEYTDTAPDPPEDWDTAPDGYNGEGEPTAYLVEPPWEITGEVSTNTPESLNSLAEAGLGEGVVTHQRWNALFNRRHVIAGDGSDQLTKWKGSTYWLEVDGNLNPGVLWDYISSGGYRYGAGAERLTITIRIEGHRIPCLIRWREGSQASAEDDWVYTDQEKQCTHADGWSAEIIINRVNGEARSIDNVAVQALF